MQKSFIDDILSNLLVFAFGEYMTVSTLVALVLAAVWAWRLWRTLRQPNSLVPELSKNAIIYSSIIGIFTFACFLTIQSIAHNYVSEKQRQELENRKPEQKLRNWLDRYGYSIKSLQAKPQDAFAIEVTVKAGEQFNIFQKADRPEVVTVQTLSIPLPMMVEKLTKLTKNGRHQFFHELRLELIRFDIESQVDLLTCTVFLHEDIPIDKSTREADFMRAIFHLRRATKTIDLFTERLIQGNYDAGSHSVSP